MQVLSVRVVSLTRPDRHLGEHLGPSERRERGDTPGTPEILLESSRSALHKIFACRRTGGRGYAALYMEVD